MLLYHKNLWHIFYCMCALTLLQCPQISLAGAWPTPAGKGQIIQTIMIDNAKIAYDETGLADIPVQFSKSETSVFWEHGLSRDYTLVLQASIQDVDFRAGVDQVNFSGPGESVVGLKRVMWRDENTVLSSQASLVIPSSGETVSDGDLGLGGAHVEGRLLLGRSFKFFNRDGFIDTQAAWRLRSGDAPDEWRVDGTVGWRPTEKLQILAQAFYANGQSATGLVRKNTRLKLQGAFVYDRKAKTSYQLGFYQTVAGSNIIKEKAVFMSMWQRY